MLPVVQTAFDEDESIDTNTFVQEIEWLYACGADGVVLAMVSEVLRLSSEERRELTELTCRAGSRRGTVVISVGAESSIVAEGFALHAEGCGAHALMATPPVALAAMESEVQRYYRRIIHAVKIPVIVQDASGYVGRPMSIRMQADLLKEFGPDRVMFKPEAVPIGPRLSELREATGGRAKVFEGAGGVALIDSFHRGIVGTMPGADLIRGIVALWRALRAGNVRASDQLSGALCSLLTLQNTLDAFVAIEKHLLVRQGIFRNTLVRGPVGFVLDNETRQEVDRRFDRIIEAIEK